MRDARSVPESLLGRMLAAGYLLAVVASTLVWVTSGADPTALVTTAVLTLPFSPLVYFVVVVVGLTLASSPFGAVVVGTLILVFFPGVALANVVLARATWRACRRRRLRRMPASTG